MEVNNAGLLCEMPRQEGNEGRSKDYHEKWAAGYSGCMPGMLHQDVQNRKSLTIPVNTAHNLTAGNIPACYNNGQE
jgi:hypothetical protein